jgi:hypothetical protein
LFDVFDNNGNISLSGGDDLSATSLVDDGTVYFESGAASIGMGNSGATAITGTGEISISSGATANLDASVGSGLAIFFGFGDATLQLDGTAADVATNFHGELDNLDATDSIDLSGVDPTAVGAIGLASNGTVLTVQVGLTTLDFDLTQALNANFIVTAEPDGSVGTDLVISLPTADTWIGPSTDGQWATSGDWSVTFNGGIPPRPPPPPSIRQTSPSTPRPMRRRRRCCCPARPRCSTRVALNWGQAWRSAPARRSISTAAASASHRPPARSSISAACSKAPAPTLVLSPTMVRSSRPRDR